MKDFFVALNYTKGYRTAAFLNILFNILSAVFNLLSLLLFIPFLTLLFNDEEVIVPRQPVYDSATGGIDAFKNYVGDYTDYFLMSWISESGKVGALWHICLIILALFFLKNLTRYLAMFYLASIRSGVVRDIRNQLHSKFLSLPLGYYSDERKGDLLTRISNDVFEIEVSIMSTLELLYREPFTILIFLGTMILLSPTLTLISLVLMPVSALVIGRIGKSLKRTSAKGQAKLGELISSVEETLGGLRIIKSFTAENEIRNRFGKLNEDFKTLSVRLNRKRDLASPLSEFLGSIVMIALVYFGGQLILSGGDSPLNGKEFITYIIVFSQLLRPVQGISTAYSNISKGLASKQRIEEVLHAHEKITEKKDASVMKPFSSSIRYENISFGYGETLVLKNISFELKQGKTIALVGQSGSGKSTIADLLPRFYDVREGAIVIDGVDIRDLTLHSLRSQMGIVSQESILFNDTVARNIALGDPNPDMERVKAAAEIANAAGFIGQLENGYFTNIGERGGKLSGGQRQRISIARAVYKNPPVLILDEATSALDTESEKLVQDALNKLMQDRTTLVIAHRLSTIQHSDEILVIHEGEIVERGTHQQLIDVNGTYRKLCDMQSFL